MVDHIKKSIPFFLPVLSPIGWHPLHSAHFFLQRVTYSVAAKIEQVRTVILIQDLNHYVLPGSVMILTGMDKLRLHM